MRQMLWAFAQIYPPKIDNLNKQINKCTGMTQRMGWGGRWEEGSGWGTHVNPWLIHVNVWQKPLQYCKVISLQIIKIIGGKERKKRICVQSRRPGFDPWVRKILWRREWLPTPVFLPEEFHGQRTLAGCSPWGLKELDTIQQLTLSLSKFICWSPNPQCNYVWKWGPIYRCVSVACTLSCLVVSDSVQPYCILQVSSVHGVLQARILEWVATPSSRHSSQPRDQVIRVK